MAKAVSKNRFIEADQELAAIVRAGCFVNKEEALQEALQTLLAVKPQLRVEAAIQRYLDEEITLGRAAELTGLTRWRLQELLRQRGVRPILEVSPAKELDQAVERLRRRRP